jgi:hypothetical protein
MKKENSNWNLLQIVEDYIATVTPEQLEKDMEAAHFDFYNNIGAPIIFPETEYFSCYFLGIIYSF